MVYTTILGIFHYWTWYNPQNNPLLGMDNPLFSIYTAIFGDIPLYHHDLPCIPHGWTLRQRDEALESKRQVLDRWWVSPCINGTKPFGKNGGGKKTSSFSMTFWKLLELFLGFAVFVNPILWVHLDGTCRLPRSHGKTFVAWQDESDVGADEVRDSLNRFCLAKWISIRWLWISRG